VVDHRVVDGVTAPPFTYFGGKQTLARRIAALFPAHAHYVEPFAGSLAVLLAKPPSAMETVNDLDSDLMVFWRVLRDDPVGLERACALTPHSRGEHQAAYDRPDELSDLERARRVWVCLTQGRVGQLKRTGWRHYLDPAGSSIGMPGYLAGYVARMAPTCERLARVSLECRPALELIEAFSPHGDVLLYVDPPYLGSTRRSSGYVHEMRAETEHRELAGALSTVRGAVILSGYPSELYDELYAGWHRVEIAASTGQGCAWDHRTEVLWSNRPLGNQRDLFDGTAP